MNEISLYRQRQTQGPNRSAIWIGAAVLLLIAGASLYIGRADDKRAIPINAFATSAAAALRRLVQDDDGPDQVLLITDERQPLPLASKGREYLRNWSRAANRGSGTSW